MGTEPISTTDSLVIMLSSAAVWVGLMLVFMVIYWPILRRLDREHGATQDTAIKTTTKTAEEVPHHTWKQVVALAALACLGIGGVGFGIDLGYLGLSLTLVMILLLKIEPTQVISRIPWGVVVLIGGLLTYIGLMQEIGSFDILQDMLGASASPAIGLLILCYIAGVTSFFANSVAVLVTAVPLIPTLIDAGLNPYAAILAVLMSAVLVDVNPFGAAGGLVVGATDSEERQQTFQGLLVYGLGAIVFAPLLAWGLFVWW